MGGDEKHEGRRLSALISSQTFSTGRQKEGESEKPNSRLMDITFFMEKEHVPVPNSNQQPATVLVFANSCSQGGLLKPI